MALLQAHWTKLIINNNNNNNNTNTNNNNNNIVFIDSEDKDTYLMLQGVVVL